MIWESSAGKFGLLSHSLLFCAAKRVKPCALRQCTSSNRPFVRCAERRLVEDSLKKLPHEANKPGGRTPETSRFTETLYPRNKLRKAAYTRCPRRHPTWPRPSLSHAPFCAHFLGHSASRCSSLPHAVLQWRRSVQPMSCT